MKIIYKPTGRALEYAELSLNIYKGCTHRCKYCFNASTPWNQHYFDHANPKEDIFKKVVHDVKKLAGTDCPEVLISFVGDSYQPIEMKLGLTRIAIGILKDYNIPFTVLTKGGLRVARDFDRIKSFGTTLVFYEDPPISYHWEPYAPRYWDRVEAIKLAKKAGIKTWVSLEPVIEPSQSIQIIKKLHRWVDHWKVGKINHCPEIEDKHDWLHFREEITIIFNKLGCNYYIKKSLSEL